MREEHLPFSKDQLQVEWEGEGGCGAALVITVSQLGR